MKFSLPWKFHSKDQACKILIYYVCCCAPLEKIIFYKFPGSILKPQVDIRTIIFMQTFTKPKKSTTSSETSLPGGLYLWPSCVLASKNHANSPRWRPKITLLPKRRHYCEKEDDDGHMVPTIGLQPKLRA